MVAQAAAAPEDDRHTCDGRPRTVLTRPTPYSASHREAAHEVRPGQRQNALLAILLCMVLRAGRRQLPARVSHALFLLQSRLLPLSLPDARPGAPKTCIAPKYESVMRHNRKPLVCDRCGGRFGMVTHRWWGNKFCKRSCKDAYLREIALDRAAIARWFGVVQFMGKAPPPSMVLASVRPTSSRPRGTSP
jgi:hypothetical protein